MSIGDKLAKFYFVLGNLPVNINELVDCINELESHVPVADNAESVDVVKEVVRDCRKKCSHVLRLPFGESISSLISTCRKRLVSKAAINSELALQHSHRHLNTMIELLGS